MVWLIMNVSHHSDNRLRMGTEAVIVHNNYSIMFTQNGVLHETNNSIIVSENKLLYS